MQMTATQLLLFDPADPSPTPSRYCEFVQEIEGFSEFGKETAILPFADPTYDILVFANEWWTSRQRAANPIHEVSYRACFKPQLPEFFTSRFTSPGDTVYDPFMGRGTTLIEAALLGRRPVGADISPLNQILVSPRLDPPTMAEVSNRLDGLVLEDRCETQDELLAFFHPHTLRQITNLRSHLLGQQLDATDQWIRMVATTRLTGHSPGFFSVYTLPPNQVVTI
jgi:hypothetical protein